MTNRKILYDNYAGMFATFDDFCQVMDQCTNNYECLVIDNVVLQLPHRSSVLVQGWTPIRLQNVQSGFLESVLSWKKPVNAGKNCTTWIRSGKVRTTNQGRQNVLIICNCADCNFYFRLSWMIHWRNSTSWHSRYIDLCRYMHMYFTNTSSHFCDMLYFPYWPHATCITMWRDLRILTP
jgi:hypothetical protein